MDDHVQNKLVEWDLGDLLSTFEDRHIALLLLPVVTLPPRHLQNPEKDGPPQLRRIYKSFHRQRTTCLPSSRRWWPPLCHNTATADCFYALSLNVAQSKRMRDFRQALTPTVPSPESPEASTTRKRSHNPDSSSSSEDETPVPYQESGISGLEEEREFIARLQNTPEKALRTSQYGRLVALTALEAQLNLSKKISERARRAAYRAVIGL
ncbi:uncharacterized protein LOC118493264 [Sander lucioperca]|uniref:uncharacterized protein LOC116047942 n=1 Tax=Sander lucioperca TaxID=283035 RepID=UPI00125E0E20|nr:uncharacterized protein LOC116047942 [Sander lucioperca]XP_031166531.1 uncharacterized protein LOC116058067 [Sander lucioperca]XP_031169050.1 uncharacterized protein LOC116059919 [Sander lucioperca]XP_035848584.1 uncharacterized protein LOC118493264 [Sander lucioperca]